MRNILIVEDDLFMGKYYAALLKKAGYEVGLMASGEGVGDYNKRTKPDILILELLLPKKDGFEVLKEVRDIPTDVRPKVLVLTELGAKEDREQVRKLGFDDYMIKTEVGFKDVITRVNKLAVGV